MEVEEVHAAVFGRAWKRTGERDYPIIYRCDKYELEILAGTSDDGDVIASGHDLYCNANQVRCFPHPDASLASNSAV